jgi:hypothetical protein
MLRKVWNTVKSPEVTNLVMAAATVAIAFFTWLTYEVVQSGSGDTQKLIDAANKQADAAASIGKSAKQFSDTAEATNQHIASAVGQLKAAADNAKANIGATQNALRLDQRAWVVVRSVGPKPEVDKEWPLYVEFTNTGKTPARNGRVVCMETVITPPKTEDDLVWKPEKMSGPTLIAPNSDQFCHMNPIGGQANQKVNKADIEAMSNRAIVIYVNGLVSYEDVFGKKHWLTYCRSMAPDGDNWNDCKKGNDTGDGEPPKAK